MTPIRHPIINDEPDHGIFCIIPIIELEVSADVLAGLAVPLFAKFGHPVQGLALITAGV